jgi:hypothetical protein
MQKRTPWIVVGLLIGLVGLAACAADKAPAKTLMGMPLLFADDFESGNADRWEPSDLKAWRVVNVGDNHVFSQFQQSKVKTPVRSPFNRAMVKGITVGDFVFEARVQSTARDYPHRDLCLFFGFQDPAHMYYVHLAKKADAHANSIFLVNGADRVSIAKKRTDGTNWDDNWHTARILREVNTGAIAVYFDDMKEPVMTAEDKTLTWGQVGLGSFDDTGNFDDVRLWGVKTEPGK